MKTLKKYLLYFCVTLLLVSCGQSPDGSSYSKATYTEAAVEASAPPADIVEYEEAAASEEPQTNDANQNTPDTKTQLTSGILAQQLMRPFILTANMHFQTKDVYQTAIAIENLAYGLGGFVLKNEINNTKTGINRIPQDDQTIIQTTRYITKGQLIIRVPTAKTQEFLRKLEPYIDYLEERNFSAQDATFDFLRAKLAYQRAQETQQDLGSAIKQTKNIDKVEAISNQHQAKQLRDEAVIQQSTFKDQTEFSTIHLSIEQAEKVHKSTLENTDKLLKQHQPKFSFEVKEALYTGWMIVIAVVLFFITIWPITIGALVIGFIFLKRYKKSQKKVKTETTAKLNKESDIEPEKND
ncbi:DUF4349 domain-containing protein [Neisseria sp. Ec49-e6-T10]|uniref:DUF4349 domain-containing protein n=1 Tax=Neisseria sp. Ec49-e6-T10 TaxID=3140744 RepID=UPI003EC04C1F